MPNPAPRPRRTENLKGTSKTPTKNSLTLLTYTAQTDRCHGIARSYACPFIQRQTKTNPAPHDASSGTSQHHKHTTQHCEETPLSYAQNFHAPSPKFGKTLAGALWRGKVRASSPRCYGTTLSSASCAPCCPAQAFGGFGGHFCLVRKLPTAFFRWFWCHLSLAC